MTPNRKDKGDRVTPPRTRPRNWDDAPNPTQSLAPPPELADLVPKFDSDLAIIRDREASAFVSLFIDHRSGGPIELQGRDADSPPVREFLEVLSSYDPMPQIAANTIAAFAAYGGHHAAQARRLLKALPLDPSPSTDCIGQATIISAHVMNDLFGEVTQYLFGVSYPDGSEGAISVLIDGLLGGILKDTLVAPDAAYVLQEADKIPEIEFEPIPISTAAAAIDYAYLVNEEQIEIEAVINEDADLLRPLVEMILDGQPRDPDYEPKRPSIDQQERLLNEFLAWAERYHPALDRTTLIWAGTAISYVSNHGHGNPVKWGPNTLFGFMNWASTQIPAEPEELAAIPIMLEVFVVWVHERAGWGTRYLHQVQAAIEDCRSFLDSNAEPGEASLLREAIEQAFIGVDLGDPDAVAEAMDDIGLGAGGTGPRVPPTEGAHPEPFDSSGLGSTTDRVTAIAEMASASALAIFDEEFVSLVRRATADAARINPDLFARGRTDIWASGVVYAVAQVNELIGGRGPLSLDSVELTSLLAGAPGTISSKATAIRSEIGDTPWNQNPRYQHSTTR